MNDQAGPEIGETLVAVCLFAFPASLGLWAWIIRRAIRHGRLLGQNKPFLHEMVFAVRDEMQDAYPELKDAAKRVSEVVQTEETRFAHTLDIGLKRLEDDLAPLVTAKQEQIINWVCSKRFNGLGNMDIFVGIEKKPYLGLGVLFEFLHHQLATANTGGPMDAFHRVAGNILAHA